MQNNVTELTQRLLQSLDDNYNVVDMPAVTEILSLLEKVAITKELLETTRLGKHVNELRRKTTNEFISKRAKELVKKWRNIFIPESNGQIKQTPSTYQEDVNLNQLKSKKRPAKDNISETVNVKRLKTNGQISEFEFSDNSNSSFKDVINYNTVIKNDVKRDINLIMNSDSNSSVPDIKNEPQLEQHLPKKRGRKKGSTNHRKLVDEAESSFSNKLAVSRGNSKVKTTQELIASLQNKNTTTSSLNISPSANVKKEDLNERAAKLTELVSIIDQKLNTNSNRFKNSQRNKNKYGHSTSADKNDRVIESGSVINDKSIVNITNRNNSSTYNTEDEIVVVDEPETLDKSGESFVPEEEKPETDIIKSEESVVKTLSVEEILAQLPPIDKSVLDDHYDENVEEKCTCFLKENKPEDFSVGDDLETEDSTSAPERFEFVEDEGCLAKKYLEEKYHVGDVTDSRVKDLHTRNIPNINGNFSKGPSKDDPLITDDGLYVNVVPNVNNETLPKDFSGENYKRYSISESVHDHSGDSEDIVKVKSEDDSDRTDINSCKDSFREWHEVVDTPSYNGEILKILPYVIID